MGKQEEVNFRENKTGPKEAEATVAPSVKGSAPDTLPADVACGVHLHSSLVCSNRLLKFQLQMCFRLLDVCKNIIPPSHHVVCLGKP